MEKKKFFWGSSTSSHQVEGDNSNNDWWKWEQEGKLKEPSNQACDHWNRYEEDFGIAQELGHNAHRFSLEWSRLETANNVWNDEAFKHYEKVLKDLKARGIEPIVTLHHFTNPQWFSDLGGWHDPACIKLFERYTKKVMEAFAPYVKYWITINEPLILLHFGYVEGTWPPGIKDMKLAFKSMRNLLHAHVASYQAIHAHYKENNLEKPAVSVAKHMGYLVPYSDKSYKDHIAVWLRNWFFNHLFIRAAQTGFLFFPGVFCEPLAQSGTMDYIALNYYMRQIIKGGKGFGFDGFMGEMRDDTKSLELNFLKWEICPEGLLDLLRQLKRYKLPIMVTENGICTDDDNQRIRYIQSHVDVVKQARSEGIPVDGYFYWSLLDNFEWAEGYDPHFGIVEVNFKTFERKVRGSAHVLSECCRKI